MIRLKSAIAAKISNARVRVLSPLQFPQSLDSYMVIHFQKDLALLTKPALNL